MAPSKARQDIRVPWKLALAWALQEMATVSATAEPTSVRASALAMRQDLDSPALTAFRDRHLVLAKQEDPPAERWPAQVPVQEFPSWVFKKVATNRRRACRRNHGLQWERVNPDRGAAQKV